MILRLACRVSRSLIALCLGAAVLMVASARIASAEYLIGPGDTIRLSIMGMPGTSVEAMVDPDGSLNLIWLGRVDAVDKSIDQLLAEVRQLSRGQVLRRYTGEGVMNLIQITEDDIFLEIAEYGPVVVTGDIAEPGEVVFRPGLTARRAIAQTGGARSSLLADVTITDPVQIVHWQNEYARAALDHAVAVVRLWRLGAEIDDDPDPQMPGPDQVAVDSSVLADLIGEQRRIMDLNRQNEAGDRAFLAESLERERDRLSILGQQMEKQRELLAADEEEEARILDLLERGLAPATRMADVRRTTVLSATRLLDIEEVLAEAELEISRLQRELNEYEETRLSELLATREITYSTALDARLLMDLYSQNLSGASGAVGSFDAQSELNITLEVLRRGKDGEYHSLQPSLDDLLHPGDTLVVTVIDPIGLEGGLD